MSKTTAAQASSSATAPAASSGVLLQMLVVPLTWGSAFALSKLGVEESSPLIAASARFGLVAMIMAGLIYARRGRERVQGRLLPMLALLGLLGVGAYNWAFFLALKWAPSTDGGLIIPVLTPVFTTLFAALFLGERLTWNKVGGLLLALAGAVLFFWVVLTHRGQNSLQLWGDLLFMASAISMSAYTLLGKKVVQRIGALPTTAWALLFGGLMILITGLPEILHGGMNHLPGSFWLNMLYLAAFPSALAYTIFYRGVGLIGAARASTFMYLTPLFAVGLSWWIFGEVPTLQQGAGALLMLVGVLLVNRR